MMISKRFKTSLSATIVVSGILLSTIILSRGAAYADSDNDCSQLPSHSALKSALTTARSAANGGFNLDMWGTIVNRDGWFAPSPSLAPIAVLNGRGAE